MKKNIIFDAGTFDVGTNDRTEKNIRTGRTFKACGIFRAALSTAVLALGLFAFTGCGAASDSDSSSQTASAVVAETAAASTDRGMNAMPEAMAVGAAIGGGTNSAVYEEAAADEASNPGATDGGTADPLTEEELISQTSRKLIRTVDITMQTTEFDELTAAIVARVTELGGYIENSGKYDSGYYSGSHYNEGAHSANYTIRIPADRTDEFINTALTNGQVTGRTENTEDVTLRYTDMESRVEALTVEQDRLLELMAEAENVDAVIALEARLSEIRYELENIKSSLKVYDNQVTYSTIYIHIDEVQVVSAASEASFTDRISAGFRQNLINLGKTIEDAAVFIIINIPAIIVIVVIVLIILIPVRKAVKAEKNLKDKSDNKHYKKKASAITKSQAEATEGSTSGKVSENAAKTQSQVKTSENAAYGNDSDDGTPDNAAR